MRSVPLSDSALEGVDVVIVVTDHSSVDYQRVAARARLVVDARGAMRHLGGSARVIGLSSEVRCCRAPRREAPAEERASRSSVPAGTGASERRPAAAR